MGGAELQPERGSAQSGDPFSTLLLSILKLKALDIVGYDALQMIVRIPRMFFSCWFFAPAVRCIPPVR